MAVVLGPHFCDHALDDPGLLAELVQALSAPTVDGAVQTFVAAYSTGEHVTEVVDVSDVEPLEYRYRPGRRYPSRFAVDRRPEPTDIVTFVLDHSGDHTVVVTAWFGPPSPREPGDPNATLADSDWWSSRAFAGIPREI